MSPGGIVGCRGVATRPRAEPPSRGPQGVVRSLPPDHRAFLVKEQKREPSRAWAGGPVHRPLRGAEPVRARIGRVRQAARSDSSPVWRFAGNAQCARLRQRPGPGRARVPRRLAGRAPSRVRPQRPSCGGEDTRGISPRTLLPVQRLVRPAVRGAAIAPPPPATFLRRHDSSAVAGAGTIVGRSLLTLFLGIGALQEPTIAPVPRSAIDLSHPNTHTGDGEIETLSSKTCDDRRPANGSWRHHGRTLSSQIIGASCDGDSDQERPHRAGRA